MSEPTVEIEISTLRAEGLPGWGETKMELLKKAESHISDALALLDTFPEPVDTHGIGDHRLRPEDRLRRMIRERLNRAKTRVDMCHNDLDCEREDAEGVS